MPVLIKYFRHIFILFIFLCFSLLAMGQDPVFSQTNHHQLFINPAYAGNSPYPRLVAGYRNQWPGLGKAFVSYYISYDQYVNKLSGNLGIAINRDVQGDGAINKTWGSLAYNYPVEFSNNTILSLGLQAGVVQKNISAGGLQLPYQNPYNNTSSNETEIIPNRSKIFPDFSAGAALFVREQYLFSFAVHHLNTPVETEGSDYIYTTPLQINVQMMAEFSTTKPNRGIEGITINPGIYAQWQNPYNYITWGSNFTHSGLITGIWFRNNLNFLVNTVIFQLGYTNGALSFVYSYDIWAPKKQNQFENYGAHEVTFISHFKYNDPKKKMRTIKCPKISR